MARGKFIVLEGPDGSGKSTQLRMIAKYMEDNKIPHICTREPGGTEIGEKIREIILDRSNEKMSAETEALLYAAARAQHVKEKIIPALEAGVNVICDRFLLSSLAYQGIGRELGVDRVQAINDFGIDFLKADLVIFYSIDPNTALDRKFHDSIGDRMEVEGYEFHKRVFEGYMDLSLREDENIKVIDATRAIAVISEDSLNLIKLILKEE